MKRALFLTQILMFCWVSLFSQDKPAPWYTNGNLFQESIVPISVDCPSGQYFAILKYRGNTVVEKFVVIK